MSMTKKDYELIAKAINWGVNGNTVVVDGDVHAIIYNLANALENNNAKFDRDRFLTACGLPNISFSDEVQYMADLSTPEGRELYKKDLKSRGNK
jgi:hypothetical protein